MPGRGPAVGGAPLPHRIQVLYVGGWGRSGSSLIARTVGQIPGFVSVGEVREIWQRGCVENQPCGCGEPFDRCPFWSQVGEAAFGGWGPPELDEALRLRYSVDRGWSAPALFLPRTGTALDGRVDRYARLLQRLYGAIAQVSGGATIVDSSKLPGHALLLRRIPGVDLRLIHLVRDSRGVAFSWGKVKSRDTSTAPTYLPQYSPFSAAARYVFYNALTGAVGRSAPYLRLRYEQFAEDPRGSLKSILRFVDRTIPGSALDFVQGSEVTLGPDHTIDGNPVRFDVGPVTVRADREWVHRMPRGQRVVVTALTYFMLRSYGYALSEPDASGG
jgi:hypothetical protein